ncbi:MAG: hypothetical protein IPK33_00485 [Gemmatimonadetes bacterium]|nr:hypothetical protein [Gemmatimonadota bacterium]
MPDATVESSWRNAPAPWRFETPVGEGFRSVNVALRKTFNGMPTSARRV